MAFRLGKNFVLSRHAKRMNFNEHDLNQERLASVFKVVKETIYLEDPVQRTTFFPNDDGRFNTQEMEEMTMYLVEGDNTSSISEQAPTATVSASGPSTSFSSMEARHRYSTSTISIPKPLMPKKSPAVQRMTRAIHLAEMDPNNFKPIITGSIYVTFEEKDANAISIASLAKEVANTAETFVICDGAGYEVLDHEGTRGFHFWRPSAKKFLALTTDKYYEALRAKSKKRKSLRSCTAPTAALTDEIDQLNEDMQSLLKITTEQAEATRDKIDEKILEIQNIIASMEDKVVAFTSGVELKITALGQKIDDKNTSDAIANSVRVSLTCPLCHDIPAPGSMVTINCCNQIIGCGSCAQRWLLESNTCYLCRSNDSSVQAVVLRGLDNVLEKLRG